MSFNATTSKFSDYIRSLPAASGADLAAGNNMPIVSPSEIKKMGGDDLLQSAAGASVCSVKSIWPTGSRPSISLGDYYISVDTEGVFNLRHLVSSGGVGKIVPLDTFKLYEVYGIPLIYDGAKFIAAFGVISVPTFRTTKNGGTEGAMHYCTADRTFFIRGTSLSGKCYIPVTFPSGTAFYHTGVNYIYDGVDVFITEKTVKLRGFYAGYESAKSEVNNGEWYYAYTSHFLYLMLNNTGTGVANVDFLKIAPDYNVDYVNEKNGLHLSWNGEYLAPNFDKSKVVDVVVNDGTPATLQGNFTFSSSGELRFYDGTSRTISYAGQFLAKTDKNRLYYWNGTNATEIETWFDPELAKFKVNHEFKDYTTEVNSTTFDGTLMSQVYAKFDNLVTNHPDIVSKSDVMGISEVLAAMTAAGFSEYPAYASDYKTYVYRLNKQSNYWGNNGSNKKKRLLLIGGLHGWEYTGIFTLYLLANNLCNKVNTDVNYFALLSTYDIWIIPCLVGYGIINNTRWNGNGVNVNRNFPDPSWEASGQPFDADYTGPSAASEFETNIVMAMADYVKPNLVVDVHNYDWDLNQQVNMIVQLPRMARYIYEAAVDISYALKKNYPTDFGSSFELITYNSTLDYASVKQRSVSYFSRYLSNPVPSSIVEVSSSVNFSNGKHVSVYPGDKNSPKVFSIAEYELMQALIRYTQFIQTQR